MQKHFLKFGKVFINVACSPLILISNNLELAAKYLPNDIDKSIKNLEIPKNNNDFFQGIEFKKEKKFFLAENNTEINEILKSFFKNIQLQLVDFKLEFGYDLRNNILLGD